MGGQPVRSYFWAFTAPATRSRRTNLANLLYPEMRKVSRSLSGIEAAKHFASRTLGCLRNFASVFNIEVAGVNVGVDPTPEPGLAEKR